MDQRRRYPTQRFRHAAGWLYTLLHPPQDRQWLPLEHIVASSSVEIDVKKAPTIEFDASPWGFGAVLRMSGRAVSFFEGAWTQTDEEDLDVVIGKPDGQTTFEYAALFLVLLTYGELHRNTGIVILGDNVASLSLALSMKGHKTLGSISREISWRRVRLGWRYLCGHLPSEQNGTADKLSRLHVDDAIRKVPAELAQASCLQPPCLADHWTVGLH